MPGHAWNVAASVLGDAASGEYQQNPFDFGDVGYLTPRPSPDIGVEVLIDPAWSDMGPPFTSQCRVCLRYSPLSDDRDTARAWLADHEAQHEGPRAPER
jgi:hypothetical protein